VSLILEALRKLEREKQAAARPGFVVVPAAQWEPGRSRLGPLLGIVFVAAVFGALGIGLYMGAARTARVRQQVAAPVATPARAVDPLPAPAAPIRATPPAVGADAAPAVRVTPALPVPPHVEAPLAEASPAPATLAPATSSPAVPEPAVPEPAVAATPANPERPEPGFVLTAIGARDGRPVAVIDDRLVAEGDEYDGWKVLAIGAESVEILYRGERRVLRFP
jgi:hypothetical protein